MKRLFSWLSGLTVAATPGIALAEGVGGYSRGNAFIYFLAIAAVLVFGIHDVFHKKWVTWASAILIPVLLYLQLPDK